MAWDPTITAGNVMIAGTALVSALVFMIRQGYTAGRYSSDFENVHKDLGEIKEALKTQQAEFRAKEKADSLADGLFLVFQQRVTHLEERERVFSDRTHQIPSLQTAIELMNGQLEEMRDTLKLIQEGKG